MAEVMVVKPGAITAADRKLLRDAGVVVVEARNPATDVVFIRASEVVSHSDMLWAAMDTLRGIGYSAGSDARDAFAQKIIHLIIEGSGRE